MCVIYLHGVWGSPYQLFKVARPLEFDFVERRARRVVRNLPLAGWHPQLRYGYPLRGPLLTTFADVAEWQTQQTQNLP